MPLLLADSSIIDVNVQIWSYFLIIHFPVIQLTITNRSWRQHFNLFSGTSICYPVFPFDQPILRNHIKCLIFFISMFGCFLILIHYQGFLHLAACFKKALFKLRNIVLMVQHILKHLKRTERSTFLTKYNIMLVILATLDALPVPITL